MKRQLIIWLCSTVFFAPAVAAADSGDRVALNLRGGGLARNDDGYAEHAGVFGLSGVGLGGGGVLEAGVRVAPRVWLFGSWSGFNSIVQKRTSELRLMTTAVLGHVRVRAYDHTFYARGQRYSFIVDASLGGGQYRLEEDFDGETRAASSLGARAGAQMTFYWRSIGYGIGYAYHHATARLEDRLGGKIGAGGHEFTGGLSVRF